MTTITIWLLVSIGNGFVTGGAASTGTVERFATQAECERVMRWAHGYSHPPLLGCIQATVARP